MKSLYLWIGRQVHTKYATLIFAVLSFIGGFFFMPLTTILTVYCLEKRNKIFFYAVLATLLSVAGGVVGYLIGIFLWDFLSPILFKYVVNPQHFEYCQVQYVKYQTQAIFWTTLLPLPYEVIAYSAGFCRIPIVNFVTLSILGRGIRFSILGTAIYIWGPTINKIIDKYFYIIFLIVLTSFAAMVYLAR